MNTTIDIGLSGMRAAQLALDVTSHNIANAGVEGYTRQRVDLATRPARLRGGTLIDGGVDVAGVSRISDRWVSRHMRNQLTEQSFQHQLLGRLGDVEAVLNDTDDAGIANAFNGLFDSISDLADTPEDQGVRLNVLSASRVLASRIRSSHDRLEAVDRENRLELQAAVGEVNANLDKVARLNRQIAGGMAARENVGDLQDERERTLADIARSLGGQINLTDDERFATVSVDGTTLVLDVEATHLEVNSTGLFVAGTTTQVRPDGGSVGAMLELRDTSIPDYLGDLNTLASSVITRFNTVHRAGRGLNGSTNLDLFSGTNASNIGVALTNGSDVAASATGSVGDHGNALALLDLRELRHLGGGGDLTFEGFHREVTAGLGSEISTARTVADGLDRLVDELHNSRDSVHSVSLDEEMTNLIRFQQAYSAAARIITAVDELTSVVLNLGR